MASDWKLRARGLCRDYAGTRLVHDVDLRLAAGEILGLLGPNGAGKTTTLRMLAGTLAPSAGQVWIGDEDLAAAPERAKRQLGYLPERPPLYPELTVDEYLGFCARLHGIARGDRRAAIASAKADCGLTDTGRRLVGQLSKGYQQRVGLAQAIVHRPDVVILDEPTAGLDPNQLRGVRDLIGRLAETHSVILSSHILPEIQAVASRVMVLHRGRVALDERMAELDGQSGAGAIDVGFAASPDAAALTELPDVAGAASIGAGRWRIEPVAGRDIRAALARTAAERGWELIELGLRRQTLEERFVALTGRDVA